MPYLVGIAGGAVGFNQGLLGVTRETTLWSTNLAGQVTGSTVSFDLVLFRFAHGIEEAVWRVSSGTDR